jgi:malonyl-CoA O-methyltransferase
MAQKHKNNVNRLNIARSFGSASQSYDISARLQRFSGKHLMPWLPNRHDIIGLDLGSGTGFFTDILASQYRQVIGLDISHEMLNFAKSHRHKDILWVEADAHKIPLKNDSIDFIYSNLVIQWFDPLDDAINEMLRVLKPGGLMIFSTLVDGTLHELKSSWKQVDDDQHVINFKTTSEVNALFDNKPAKLLEKKSQDIILEYENVYHLARELKGLGANHLAQKKNKGLAGKDKWSQMAKSYKDFIKCKDVHPATYCLFSGLVVKL